MNGALGLLISGMVDWYLSQNSYCRYRVYKHGSNTQEIKKKLVLKFAYLVWCWQ